MQSTEFHVIEASESMTAERPHIQLYVSQSLYTTLRHPLHLDTIDQLEVQLRGLPYFPRAEGAAITASATGTDFSDCSRTTQPPPPQLVGANLRTAARHLAATEDQHHFAWVHLVQPSDDDLKRVLSWLPLHPFTVETLLSPPQQAPPPRPHQTDEKKKKKKDEEEEEEEGPMAEDKIEYFPAHGYACVTLTALPLHFTADREESQVIPVRLLLFHHLIVCVAADHFAGEDEVAMGAAELGSADKADGTLAAPMTVSTILASYIASLVNSLQSRVRVALIDGDNLDELVMQIVPSSVDFTDLQQRVGQVRHKTAYLHLQLLFKERLLQQLLLPVLRQTCLCPGDPEHYQRSLATVRRAIERVRRGRDAVQRTSMSLINGVCARLTRHCHWMDYLNHVQAHISLIVMPINVLPGVFAMNCAVPFTNATTNNPFWILTGITLGLLVAGMIYPFVKYKRYRTPTALTPLD